LSRDQSAGPKHEVKRVSRRTLSDRLFTPVDAASLAVFRIGFAGIMRFEMLRYFYPDVAVPAGTDGLQFAHGVTEVLGPGVIAADRALVVVYRQYLFAGYFPGSACRLIAVWPG
jgi:hypothetical protein